MVKGYNREANKRSHESPNSKKTDLPQKKIKRNDKQKSPVSLCL